MIRNVGTVERIVRIVLGIMLGGIGLSVGGVVMWLLSASAVGLFLTAALRYCPITHAIGISTEGNSIHRLNQA